MLADISQLGKDKDPRVGGSIVASSSMKLHKKILNLLKPVC